MTVSNTSLGTPVLASAWDRLWWGGNVEASTFAEGVDHVFFYIFWVSLAFFVLLMWLMVYWAFKYRRRPGVAPQPSPSHNTALELTWSIVPTILLAVMFFWGLIAYIPMKVAPANAEVINVTARKWAWGLVYDNGASPLETEVIADAAAPIFALPVNRPIKFIMSSQDVIHSMYMPAFRIKRDVFPNFYTSQWVEATKITHRWEEQEKKFVPVNPAESKGYYLACTEYCGDQHSQMWGRVMVLADADYALWKNQQADTSGVSLPDLGAKLYKSKGCNACHSVDGSAGTGPTWTGIWGKTHEFTDGGSALVDENYLRESILEPAKHIVRGYANQMPTFQGQLTDRELLALITYIRILSDNPQDKAAAEEFSARELEESKAAKNAPAN
ncbi:MAG: cytochrome c oxidase subunit II [Planctomycetota bacterium]|nr:cytochrome c oxidase subunit II [Planctomycetota bacterium]